MGIIFMFASIIGVILAISVSIFILVLIDSIICYFRAKTDLLNRQIEEYDFSRPKNK